MDLDDILNSALDEVEFEEEEVSKSTAASIKTELSEVAATSAKTQTEAAAKAAEARNQSSEADELSNMLKMLSTGGDGGDFEKMLGDVFKDLDMNDLMSKLTSGQNGEPDMEELMKMFSGGGTQCWLSFKLAHVDK